MFDTWFLAPEQPDSPDTVLPDEIPDWLLQAPPLSEPPCECCSEPDEPGPGWAVPGVTWEATPRHARPSLSPAVLALKVAVDRVCRLDARRSSPEQALVDGEAILQIGQRLRVAEVHRLGDVRERELFALSGHRSTSAWLRDQQPDADLSLAGLAGRLAGFPGLARSVMDGRCSLTAAKRGTQALLRCRPHVDRPDGSIDEQPGEQVVTAVIRHVPALVAGCLLGMSDDDPRFIALTQACEGVLASPGGELERLDVAFTMLAEQVPGSMLAGCLEDLVLAVLPSVLEDRGERGRAAAALSLEPTPDGTGWRLEGRLDLECGERLFTALSAEVRRDALAPADTEAAARLRADGLDPFEDGPEAGRPWPRSRRQVLHDALDALLGRYLESGCGGTSQKVPVQVCVTVPAGAVDNTPGALPGRGDSGSRIPRSLLRRWWCDSSVTAYVLSTAGRALRVVHGGRTLSARERRAAAIEQRGRCAGHGCCRGRPGPGRDLRPHHVRRWIDDGRTSLDETLLVCDALHRDLHEGGRAIRLRDGRYLSEQGWAQPSH